MDRKAEVTISATKSQRSYTRSQRETDPKVEFFECEEQRSLEIYRSEPDTFAPEYWIDYCIIP